MYGGTEIRKLMQLGDEAGYTIVPFADTVCGLGSFVMLAPDDEHMNVVVTEHYATEWSCKYTVRRCRKISKRLQKLIDDFAMEEG